MKPPATYRRGHCLYGKCSRCQKPRKAPDVYDCDCWNFPSPKKPKRKS